MTKREKREAKIRGLGSLRFEELAEWFQDEDFLRQPGGKGSHVRFTHPLYVPVLVIVRPHGGKNAVPEYQVREAITAVDAVRAARGEAR